MRDIDGDGDQDILFLPCKCNPFANELFLYLENTEENPFQEIKFAGFSTNIGATKITTRDLNGDGWLDPIAYVPTSFLSSSTRETSIVRVSLSNADGTFSFDYEDHLLELINPFAQQEAIVESEADFLQIQFLSEENNFLSKAQVFDLIPGPNFQQILLDSPLPPNFEITDTHLLANFDNIGELDLFIQDQSGNIAIWTRNENFSPTFTHSLTFNTNGETLRIDDLNGDGFDDIWFKAFNSNRTTQGISYRLFDPTNQSFAPPQTQLFPELLDSQFLGWARESSPTGPATFLALAAELDDSLNTPLISFVFDEWIPTVIPSNAGTPLNSNRENTRSFIPPGTFSPLLQSGTPEEPGITIYANFAIPHPLPNIPLPNFPLRFAGIQFASANWTPSSTNLEFTFLTPLPLLNNLNNLNTSQTPENFSPFLAGDLNEDGLIDLIQGPNSNLEYAIRFNSERDGFTQPLSFDLIPDSYLATIPDLFVSELNLADIDQDSDLDLIITYLDPDLDDVFNERAICISALNNGDATFTFPPNLPSAFASGFLSRSCSTIAFVDWDSDGDLDLIDSTVGWRENLGNGNFSTNSRLLAPSGLANTDIYGNPSLFQPR